MAFQVGLGGRPGKRTSGAALWLGQGATRFLSSPVAA
jgi:hypothetical protein